MTAPVRSDDLALARRHAAEGRYRRARAGFRAAIARNPRNADLLIEAGVLEAQHGQAKAARRLFEKAAALRPDDPAVHLNLGELARQTGATGIAERHFARAVALAPDDVDAVYGLGECLLAQDRNDDALPHLRKAHALSPRDPEIMNALANAVAATGGLDEAIALYRAAVAIDPGYVDAWCNLATAAYDAERQDISAHAFAAAERAGGVPKRLYALWAKALAYLADNEAALARADAAIAAGVDLVRAHYVRGVVLQRLGRFDEANACFRKSIEIDPDAAESYEKLASSDGLPEEFLPRLTEILQSDTMRDSARIAAGFALYRLLGRLGRHDEAFEALATANALKAAKLPFRAEDLVDHIDRAITTFTPEFFAARKGQGLDVEGPVFILGMPRSGTTLTEQILAGYREVHAGGERLDFNMLAQGVPGYPDAVAALGADWARANAEAILGAMRTGAPPDARLFTNKAPGNYVFIGLIAWLFPKAKVIYCRRDPRDIGLSCFEQHFRQGLSFTYDLAAFGMAYRQHERIMAHWRSVSPIDFLEVEYEKLVTSPESQARRLVEHCGLDWRPDCLTPEKVERAVETASLWQVRQPINARSVGKWRRYERQLRPMIEALGLE